MPPRIARGPVQSNQKSQNRTNSKNSKYAAKRALNALVIAQHENPDKSKIRQGRLGGSKPSADRKRLRDGEHGAKDDSEEDSTAPKRRKGEDAEESYDEGSDSEGNTWQMGYVADSDDEDIDSDEAFGETDDEKFEGFTFRGSSKPQKRSVKESGSLDVDLNEDDGAYSNEEEMDDFGADAIDLATALDQYEESETDKPEKKRRKDAVLDYDNLASSLSDASGAFESFSSENEDDEEDEEDRQAQLSGIIASLATKDAGERSGRKFDHLESTDPDEFAVMGKVDFSSLMSQNVDEEKKSALKFIGADKSSRGKTTARKLDAPLPKRQQDKLNRAAASAKANETLDRWTETIKQNRRAEHLMFPSHESEGALPGEKKLLLTTNAAPTNDLESVLQSILQQSGLSGGKDDEEQIRKWEELQSNKLPFEEVMKRRARLRMERELLFREEVRAKRIKKIKSKAYRRIHRKEREGLLQREQAQLKADNANFSEEEREYNERRRAEERMGAKHRESKWAKSVKETGQAKWDRDALNGISDMARRNEELRRRIEGKTIHNEDDDGLGSSSEDDENVYEDQDNNEALQKSLSKLKPNPFSTSKSSLSQMAFMQKAEAAKRRQNDETIEQIRRELAGEDSVNEDEEVDESSTKTGRKKYGPSNGVLGLTTQSKESEFEERPDLENEEEQTRPAERTNEPVSSAVLSRPPKAAKAISSNRPRVGEAAEVSSSAGNEAGSANPFLVEAKKDKRAAKKPGPGVLLDCTNVSLVGQVNDEVKSHTKSTSRSKPAAGAQESTIDPFLQQRVSAADQDGWAVVIGGPDSDEASNADDAGDVGIDLDIVRRNQALTAKAFAGDNVAAEFAAQKKAIVEEEAPTETIATLPGWGSWFGSGLSAQAQSRARSRDAKTIVSKDGVQANRRRDSKLDKVIINEKRVKPNVKYMATQVPFPFESREQYERSLRLPKGQEWVTKRKVQEGTKPRVIVKQGVIAPMRKPLL